MLSAVKRALEMVKIGKPETKGCLYSALKANKKALLRALYN